MKNPFSKNIFIGFVLALFLICFLFRFRGLTQNHPFWVDEFSSAHQAEYILKYGVGVLNSFNKAPLYFENRNITTHALIALSFRIFGEHEWSARFPIILIGSFIPVVLFFLAKYLFDSRVAIGSMLFATFSYFEIVWSRQARGYAIQQLLTLIAIYLYLKLLNKKRRTFLDYGLICCVALLGIVTHTLFVILIGAVVLHYLFVSKKWKTLIVMSLAGGALFLYLRQGLHNNLWYYHSFLWREYGLITFLAISGMALSLEIKHRWISFMILYITFHIFALSLLFGPYTSRYLNPIFPILLMFAAYAIVRVSDLALMQTKRGRHSILNSLIPLVFVLFVIANGDKFVTKPKPFYSVNHDFREIALIDYHQVYDLMKRKGEFDKGQTAIVETWLDRMHWYMGQDFMHAYELKWKNGGIINGLPTNSPYLTNARGEKTTLRYKDIGFINELPDLQRAMKKYPKGFIFIDDSSLPQDIQTFAAKHLKKELYLDHYPLDDNPYSIWPATLYSWGIK